MVSWQIYPETGFLLYPSPSLHLTTAQSSLLSATAEALDTAAAHLSEWLVGQQFNSLLYALKAVKIEVECIDSFTMEHILSLYGYFASAWVHGFGKKRVPVAIALPLVTLAQAVNRPPMLSYAGQVLANWHLKDPQAGFTPDNVALLHTFTDLVDESWFFRVHVAIEAQSGKLLHALRSSNKVIEAEDDMGVLEILRILRAGLVDITKTFHHMPDLCDPDVYFQRVRPYLMSFSKEIVYEGVESNPTPLRGGSGAQSSIVPALLAGLGIEHKSSDLIDSLLDMRRYMPVPHRTFIQQMRQIRLREYCALRPHLADAYNHVLRQLMTFRRAHLYFAKTYIFEKSTTGTGTGGTNFMVFLSQLIDETEQYML